jgi:hypothetical protein
MRITNVKVLSIIAACASLAVTPAMAWDYNQGGNHNQQIGDNATGFQANQSQHQTQHQTAAGGSGGAGGGGGMGGSASSGATATGGSGGYAVSGNSLDGVGNTNVSARSAPSMGLPSLGGGGFDCPVVGIGAVGSGLGGGGGLGPTWISKSCNNRKVTEMLYGLFGPAVAREFAIQNIDGVAEALSAASQTSIDVTVDAPALPQPIIYCDYITKDGFCGMGTPPPVPSHHHHHSIKTKCPK